MIEDPENRARVLVSGSREVRGIPLGWKHPRDESGEYTPLKRRDLAYTEEKIHEGLAEGWLRSRNDAEDNLMPDFTSIPGALMGICLYETTTEGTPLSPVYPNTSEGRFQLAKYCTETETTFAGHTTDIEGWAA